jgi:DNA-binding LacI/PurR family transcriptional regulator
MTSRQVSIKHIAELAGVSYPTVSRALRGQGRMSDATRQRIIAIAREHGYSPSLAARSLVSRRSYAFGLVVTNLADPFHGAVVQGVEQAANRHGYGILLAGTSTDPEHEIEIVRSFHGHRVDGIIVSSGSVGDRYADLFRETGVPIVLVNSHAEQRNVHSVCHDDYDGARAILRHLLERGHRHIAYLGNASAGKVQADRLRAWHDTAAEYNLPAAPVDHGESGNSADGARATERLLDEHAEILREHHSAIWCFNDAMAIGAISVLRRRGLGIPGQIAVAGFDDIEAAEYTSPPLTTWRQPRHDLGRAAAHMLLDLISGNGDGASCAMVLRGELIAREST